MDETTIWEGRPQLLELMVDPKMWVLGLASVGIVPLLFAIDRLNTHYKVTNQRVIFDKGIFFKTTDDIELYRVKDSKVRQGPIDRIFGLGLINLITSDASGKLELVAVADARALREKIRAATEMVKQARNVRIQTE